MHCLEKLHDLYYTDMQERTIEPISIKCLACCFYHRAGTERIGTKTRTTKIQSHRQSYTEEK